MASTSSTGTCVTVPGTALASGPLQHLQMASTRCSRACTFIPGTALASQPLQHLQMASFSSIGTCHIIPGTALASCPLQDPQMAPTSSIGACAPIPRAALASCPLKHLQMTLQGKKGSEVLSWHSITLENLQEEKAPTLADTFAYKLPEDLHVIQQYHREQFIGKQVKAILHCAALKCVIILQKGGCNLSKYSVRFVSCGHLGQWRARNSPTLTVLID